MLPTVTGRWKCRTCGAAHGQSRPPGHDGGAGTPGPRVERPAPRAGRHGRAGAPVVRAVPGLQSRGRLESGEQLVRLTEQLGGAVRALEVQVRVVLPGDRDAAVQLDGL